MDIMIIVQPQNGKKWSYPCKLCQFSSTDCQLCSSKSRHNSPICDCHIGYFENHDSLSFYCLTCKEGRVTELCLCQDGYFEAQYIHCFQCENKCLTCSNTSANCLQYKIDRVNISNCICLGAYYDDLENEYCQQCLDFVELVICKTALSCMGNRMLTTDMSYDEPLHSKCHFATPWCSSILLYVIFPLKQCILCHNFMRILFQNLL